MNSPAGGGEGYLVCVCVRGGGRIYCECEGGGGGVRVVMCFWLWARLHKASRVQSLTECEWSSRRWGGKHCVCVEGG